MAGCAAAPRGPAGDPALARLEVAIDSLRQAAGIPGLSMAVVRDGRVVLARGFGWADVEARVPATDTTPYDIASVTKPISAVVALRLVEQRRLDLDRPMRDWAGFAEFCADVRAGGGIFFRDYRCDSAPITLRHLLTMTANGAPGTAFLYNPVSYSWASRPMTQAAGEPFSQLVAELVFAPAGMTRSARIHRALPLRPDLAAALAKPYHVDSATGRPVRSTAPPPQGDGAAGGVVSTVRDLAAFDVALDAGRLLGDSLRAVMWTPTRTPAGGTLPYAVGWFVRDYGPRRALWHTGVWDGRYSALYLKLPAERLTLILLANADGLRWPTPLDGGDVRGSAFAQAFAEAMLGHAL